MLSKRNKLVVTPKEVVPPRTVLTEEDYTQLAAVNQELNNTGWTGENGQSVTTPFLRLAVIKVLRRHGWKVDYYHSGCLISVARISWTKIDPTFLLVSASIWCLAAGCLGVVSPVASFITGFLGFVLILAAAIVRDADR